jgi:hypothetical protein
MEIVIIGLMAAMVFVGLLALDPDSPNARGNVVGCVRGVALGLAALALWWFAPLWARAII